MQDLLNQILVLSIMSVVLPSSRRVPLGYFPASFSRHGLPPGSLWRLRAGKLAAVEYIYRVSVLLRPLLVIGYFFTTLFRTGSWLWRKGHPGYVDVIMVHELLRFFQPQLVLQLVHGIPGLKGLGFKVLYFLGFHFLWNGFLIWLTTQLGRATVLGAEPAVSFGRANLWLLINFVLFIADIPVELITIKIPLRGSEHLWSYKTSISMMKFEIVMSTLWLIYRVSALYIVLELWLELKRRRKEVASSALSLGPVSLPQSRTRSGRAEDRDSDQIPQQSSIVSLEDEYW